MRFKKRRMMFIPDVNSTSFVFFFERGKSGTSWSIRDYSTKSRIKEFGPHDFHWTADEIHQRAVHSIDAPTIHTENLEFWHNFTEKCNHQYLQNPGQDGSATSTLVLPPPLAPCPQMNPVQQPSGTLPVLDLPELLSSPKGRKNQDMNRILHSPDSEDWVTWNFCQIMLRQYPSGWWGHLVSAARRRNADLSFPFDDRSLPRLTHWTSVSAPPEYEAHSRLRMQTSGDREWIARADNPAPVEGPSEIDVTFDHDQFLVYVEAKLGSDISMNTKYDPQRNQIVRNIDCLIENAVGRLPMFWMLARDEAPERAYVQLMKSYKADPFLLARELPHREQAVLDAVAHNLTILLWSDFSELVCGLGWDAKSSAVKRELERRIIAVRSKAAQPN